MVRSAPPARVPDDASHRRENREAPDVARLHRLWPILGDGADAPPQDKAFLASDSHFKQPVHTVVARSEATKQSSLCLWLRIASLRSQSTERHTSTFSRRTAPELCKNRRPQKVREGQGRPGARCTRGLVRKNACKSAHEHTGSRRQSGLPCATALRLISRSSGRPVLSPSPLRSVSFLRT